MSTRYDSSEISLVVGTIQMAGFGDNKVVISRNGDVSTITDGLDGEVVFSTSNKRSGTISFDLLYGTDYDLYMDNLASATWQFPVVFTHLQSRKALATNGMVMTQPDIELGETPIP